MTTAHEAHAIEDRRLQDDLDLVIVTVQSGAGMRGRQAAVISNWRWQPRPGSYPSRLNHLAVLVDHLGERQLILAG
jgi:hypothetical protein